MKTAVCLSALIPLLSSLLRSQNLATESSPALRRHRQYPDIAKLVDLAQTVPAEFSAHFMLQAAMSPRLRDEPWRKELLEQAFQSANRASEPVRQKSIRSEEFDVTRTRGEMIGRGFDEALDRLTLQSLSVREMLNLDRPRALGMFQSISFPRLSARQCADALVDDVSVYYEVLGEIVDTAFSALQRREGRHLELLDAALGHVISSAEPAPLAEVLASGALTMQERAAAASKFAGALDRVENDDRSFSASLRLVDRKLHRLVQMLRANGVAADGVSTAYRRYLVRNFTGGRCADNIVQTKLLGAVADAFNGDFASALNADLATLSMEEMKPDKILGRANDEPFIDDADEELLGRFIEFLTKSDNAPHEESQSAFQWQGQFDGFLRQIDEFKPVVGQPEYRYFYRKANALTALLGVAPAGSARNQLLRQLVAFLGSSNLQQESPIEWYAQVCTAASAVGEPESEGYAQFLRELESSGNPLLALYALAARAAPVSR